MSARTQRARAYRRLDAPIGFARAMRSTRVFFAAALAVFLLAGCGGGDDDNKGILSFTQLTTPSARPGRRTTSSRCRGSAETARSAPRSSPRTGPPTAGVDYTPQTILVTWDAGDVSQKTIEIPILEDHADEVDETITLRPDQPDRRGDDPRSPRRRHAQHRRQRRRRFDPVQHVVVHLPRGRNSVRPLGRGHARGRPGRRRLGHADHDRWHREQRSGFERRARRLHAVHDDRDVPRSGHDSGADLARRRHRSGPPSRAVRDVQPRAGQPDGRSDDRNHVARERGDRRRRQHADHPEPGDRNALRHRGREGRIEALHRRAGQRSSGRTRARVRSVRRFARGHDHAAFVDGARIHARRGIGHRRPRLAGPGLGDRPGLAPRPVRAAHVGAAGLRPDRDLHRTTDGSSSELRSLLRRAARRRRARRSSTTS